MSEDSKFDVFLSHNSNDKPAVIALAKKLKKSRLNVWLDIWELRPGQQWQDALEQIIETTQTAAVLVGKDGLGPWEDMEMRACLVEFVKRKLPVIPVLLPDCPKEKPNLPLLLRSFTWVDLRDGNETEGFQKLIWGITGSKPKELDAHSDEQVGMVPPAETPHRNLNDNSKSSTDHCLPERLSIKSYRQAANEKYRNLLPKSFKNNFSLPIELKDLYIPLQAIIDLRINRVCNFIDFEEAQSKLNGHRKELTLPGTALKESRDRNCRGLVIIGKPGAGMTTYLHYVLLNCLNNTPEKIGLEHSDTVPVFLPLRKFNDFTNRMPSIANFIEHCVEDIIGPHRTVKGFGNELLQKNSLLLFDGLDEISDSNRRSDIARWIVQALTINIKATVIVTCRFAGYNDDVHKHLMHLLHLYLKPFSFEQARRFIHAWYYAVENNYELGDFSRITNSALWAENLINELEEPGERSKRIKEMATNPFLLYNICLVHRYRLDNDRKGLPAGRNELYHECIGILLKLKPDISSRLDHCTDWLLLQHIAYRLHHSLNNKASKEECIHILNDEPIIQQWDHDAEAFLTKMHKENGLLIYWTQSDEYSFTHLGFQEYLTACELTRQLKTSDKKKVIEVLTSHYHESWWQEVILLFLAQGDDDLFNEFIYNVIHTFVDYDNDKDNLMPFILKETLCVPSKPFLKLIYQPPSSDNEDLWKRQYKALCTLQKHRLLDHESMDELAGKLQEHPSKDIKDWAKAQLNNAEKPSAQENVRKSLNGNVELLKIPAGSFQMGSPDGDTDASPNEKPAHQVEIKTFYLGRYPVTNAEYERFLTANPKIDRPPHLSDNRFNDPLQPVVNVSWFDACAFAEWAGGRLPSDAEWEYATRAGTTTSYWWGDEMEPDRANGRESKSPLSNQQTSPVDFFAPNKFGLYDTSGNVREWVQNREYSYRNVSGYTAKENKAHEENRVIRGGAWDQLNIYLRSAHRDALPPLDKWNSLGFRLAMDE